jgi:hypothetical protein
LFYRSSYYESNNVLVRINGLAKDALLISAHFDSTLTSHGVTDDGIGIASMVSVLERLARDSCRAPLKHSVLFNFNNAEEYGLYGGAAFTKHPWFHDAKAFINLEGTGASESQPACLFRTNSFELTNLLLQRQTFPHASVLFNALMKVIRSDTDYRVYGTVGNLPGVDIAFYSYRYLYHSPLDDLAHSSVQSLGHMIENVYSSVNAIIRHPNLLSKIKLEDNLKTSDPFGVLPVPDFAFYDRFGFWGVFQSRLGFISSHMVLLVCIVSVAFLKGITALAWGGRHSFLDHALKPALDSFLLVISTVIFTLSCNLTMSFIKAWFNPGITYGKPELVIATIVLTTFACICAMELIWPRISRSLRLSNRHVRFESIYEPLPISTPLRDDTSSQADSIPEEEVPLAPDNFNETIHTDESEADEFYIQPRSAPRHRRDRMMTAWLPVGLCLFWTCFLILSLWVSFNGLSVFYFFYDFALFSSIAVMITIIFDQIYKKLLHEDLDFEYNVHERRFIEFYENYFWLVQTVIAAPIPAMFLVDVFKQVYLGLPSLVGEGVPDYMVDLVFSSLVLFMLLNFMPLLSRTNRKYSTYICIVLISGLWIPQLFMFPLSESRPYRYTYSEKVDISSGQNASVSQFEVRTMPIGSPENWVNYMRRYGVAIPDYAVDARKVVFSLSYRNADLNAIEMRTQAETHKATTVIRGLVIGSPGSRFCKLNITTPVIRSWVDQQSNWIDYVPHERNQTEISILKRTYNYGLDRIQFDFGFEMDRSVTKEKDVKVTVQCYHGMEKSQFYAEFTKQPSWMMDIGVYGFTFEKSVMVTLPAIN